MTIHIIGAGCAGLAAALRVAEQGGQVVLYESAPQAGGRCRSYHDAKLGCRLDNGTHLLLGANRHAWDFIDRIGARAEWVAADPAAFPFYDLQTGERFVIRPGRWIPGVPLRESRYLLRLLLAGPGRCVAECVPPQTALFRRFIAPLTLAALNTPPESASAQLLARVLRRSFLAGRRALTPWRVRHDLETALIAPARNALRRYGVPIEMGRRISGMRCEAGRVMALQCGEKEIPLTPDDAVIAAVPPAVAHAWFPALPRPNRYHSIYNIHFLIPEKAPAAGDQGFGITGVLGGYAEWIWHHPPLVSVTVSAADAQKRACAEAPSLIWREVCWALGWEAENSPLPPYRIIHEKRATFAATPANLKQRPDVRSPYNNLFLAGDWVDTGLPATIDGAVASGFAAAGATMRWRNQYSNSCLSRAG